MSSVCGVPVASKHDLLPVVMGAADGSTMRFVFAAPAPISPASAGATAQGGAALLLKELGGGQQEPAQAAAYTEERRLLGLLAQHANQGLVSCRMAFPIPSHFLTVSLT